jgi:mannose/fructose/N-acetylgalactosamine-specific phosphotransferase system component IIC
VLPPGLQQDEEADSGRLSLLEWLEWGAFIVAILAYWPLIFVSLYHPASSSPAYAMLVAVTRSLAYELVIYGVIPVVLLAILIRRIRLFAARVEEEEEKRTGPPRS